tara:strand:- start:528 stop:2363 length:1836 start_codon:yes stop_codon:yes gene_type:complete
VTSILGISAFYHDSAASLVVDGKIIAAAQEERFSRIKHDKKFPKNSINFVLNFAKINLTDVDYIVFYEKPFLKFERLLETYVGFAPRGLSSFCKAIPVWIKDKLFQKKLILQNLNEIDEKFINDENIYFSEHHLSHAASAFYPSPFEKAIILTADGVGEWATTTVAIGNKEDLEIKKEIHFPHSLGLLYSAFTYYCGFRVNSGEYKLMGLAPYGKPIYESLIKEKLISIKNDGSFGLEQKYFNYSTGLTMTNEKFNNLFGEKNRKPEEELTQFHMDIAASIQKVIEEIMIKIVTKLKEQYNLNNLCLAGGVALNCVVNGKIFEKKIFDKIWIQPAAGDAGCSVGAALAFWYQDLKKKRSSTLKDEMNGSYLGPQFEPNEIEEELKNLGANYKIFQEDDVINETAKLISQGKAIGWFQGRMEFGPRALGGRSILADPRDPKMQKNLNLKVKFRESFRPFAPSILSEKVAEWFNYDEQSPYMLIVSGVKSDKRKFNEEQNLKLKGFEKLSIERSKIPAVTHVDYSARIQTVDGKFNYKYYLLLQKFEDLTGCPILINTSFNIRGEPIVCSIQDAFNCFMGTNLDYLVIENFILNKLDQKEKLNTDYKNQFKLD